MIVRRSLSHSLALQTTFNNDDNNNNNRPAQFMGDASIELRILFSLLVLELRYL